MLVAAVAVTVGVLPAGATDEEGVGSAGGDAVTAAAGAAPGYSPLPPVRLLDTRPGLTTIDGIGAGQGAIGPAATRDLVVTGRGGVPASGVGAVVLNVTVTAPTAHGFLTVHPKGTARPNASNLNFVPGQTRANQVIAKVGTGGRLSIFNSTGATHVVADVAGWVPSGASYTGLTPARLLDTRPGATTADGQSAGQGAIGPAATRDLVVLGRGGVPGSGVGAVVLNVTVTGPTAAGFLTVHPKGTARPNASNLNFVPGETVPNLVIAKVGSAGKVAIFNRAGATHVVADVVGWFPPGAAAYTGLTPARLADTRPGGTTVDGLFTSLPTTSNLDHWLTVTGRGGVPATGVGAVVLNVTIVNPSQAGHLVAYPHGAARPNASVLNYAPGQTVPNLVIAKVGTQGRVVFGDKRGGHLVIDVLGWLPTTAMGGITHLSVGSSQGCLLVAGGIDRCWGGGTSAAVPTDGAGVVGATAITASTAVRCARLADSRLACWGRDYLGEPGFKVRSTAQRVPGLGAVVDAATVGPRTCAVLTTGTVKCWGSGHLGNGSAAASFTPVTVTGISDAIAVAMGDVFTCALRSGGTVKCWGSDDFGALGNGAIVGIQTTPTDVEGLTGATQISAGSYSACARLANGTAKCWGDNLYGQTGDGTTTQPRNAPVTVAGLSDVVQVATGGHHACARRATGQVRCWGRNQLGQLGDGTEANRLAPVVVTGLSGIAEIDADLRRTCARSTGGYAWCWGGGPLGDGGNGAAESAVPAPLVN